MAHPSPKAKVRHDSAVHPAAPDEEGRRAQSSSVSRSESQHKDERNFRSHYLGKVGLLGVDEKKTLELLLNEDPVSISKCAHFAIKCPVPSARRLHLWKVILGITASHQNNADYVWKWRAKPYHDVMRALKVMEKVHTTWPKAKNMAVAYLLFAKCLYFESEKQLSQPRAQHFMAVAETMTKLSEDEIEVFWIAKGLTQQLETLSQETMSELNHSFLTKLGNSSTTSKLFGHLEKIGLIEELPFETWVRRGFAGVLHEAALEKVWDKVIGGSFVILIYLAIQLIETTKTALFGCQTPKEAIRCLTSTSEQTDEIMAQKAVEQWGLDGHQLLPGDGSKHHHHHHHHHHSQSRHPSGSLPSTNTTTRSPHQEGSIHS
ncbi:hypothetical protein TCAL_00688 [Tigriopus californicus]|uniref:Rab-GAP TBC domain-containing protein n=2 Tax=Tigriopus californicus TaxID=6832 RepID=A0A553PC76_TIGCA|nr:hypothetical protein TCAL_00688 [Tigriopus californicus]